MPLVDDGSVLIADGSGSVAALTETAGTTQWTVAPGGRGPGSLVIVGDEVIDGAADGGLHAIDLETGAPGWSHVVAAGERLSISSDGQTIVAASAAGHVVAVDTAGTERWRFDVGGPVARGPAIAAGIGYVGSASGRVVAFRLDDGREIWHRDLGNGEITTPAVAARLVFVAHGIGDGHSTPPILFALDATTGAERWHWTSPAVTRLFVGAVEGSSVYLLDERGAVTVVDIATGTGRPFHAANGPYGALAAIVGPTIYLASSDHVLVAVDRASGTVAWSVSTQGAPSAPAVVDGRVFLTTDLGKVVAFGDASGSAASP
jgi:outer membrane protein assembly factor BamB